MQNLCRLNHYTWNAQQQKFSLSYSFPFGCRFSSTASSNTEEKQYGEFIAKLPSYVGGNVELELNNVNGVAVIKIDNPKSRNALTGYMITKLNDIVDQLHFWKEGKAVVMLGTKDQFCSGGDLRYFMNHMKTSQHGSFMCRYMQDLMMRFTNLPLLTVAAIQGNTLGGGAEVCVSLASLIQICSLLTRHDKVVCLPAWLARPSATLIQSACFIIFDKEICLSFSCQLHVTFVLCKKMQVS